MIVLLTESLASGSLRWAFWGGPALSQPVRYRFEVLEPPRFRADLVVEGDTFRVEEPSDYYLWVEGGVTKRNIIYALKEFVAVVRDAQSLDTEGVLS